MKKPHQHFIPQTYLRKFAHSKNKEAYLVDAFDKIKNKSIENMSVYALCAETDLYTLKNLEGNQKYVIEDFFSDNIESKYPQVYKLLVQDKKKTITLAERVDILYTILSMYFRTPKALNKFSEFSTELLEKVTKHSNVETIDFLGYKISLKEKSFKEIKNEIKETNRVNFIQTQLALLKQFVEFKVNDGLVVIELIGDQEFVTSDNPVDIGNHQGTITDLFDLQNSIYVPLDPKHALYIAPKMDGGIVNKIFYQRDNFFQHIMLNNSVFQNAERWVIGTKKGIDQFQKNNKEYSKPSDDNHPIVIRFKTKLELMTKILSLAENGISNENIELIDYFKEIKEHPIFNEDIDLIDLYNQFKGLGLKI